MTKRTTSIFNFSAVSETSLVGGILRQIIYRLPKNLVVPILQGRLRGKRWIIGSGVNGYWLGSYEWEKRVAFEQTISPGSIVLDIGANVGFYTLLASQLVGPRGQVVAFEPLPRNVQYLRKHLRMNRAANVTIHEVALSDQAGTATFDTSVHPAMGRLGTTGTLTVKTDVLDNLIASGAVPRPDFIKMDIEGGELASLNGARQLLSTSSPTLFLATHSDELNRACRDLLGSLGYRIDAISPAFADELIARKP